MKKTFILICATLIFINAKSQLRGGLKAGINFAKENYHNDIYATSSHVFFCGGLFGNYKISNSFAAQLEALYSGEGTDENYSANGSKVTGVVTINRINVPLLLQYNTLSGLYFETGPQAGFLISAKGKYTNGNYDFKNNTKSTLISWCLGAGYKIRAVEGFGVGLRYATGLSNINKGTVNANSINSSVFSAMLAYTFPHF